MRKHSVDMTAAWAKDWGIRGYDHLDPQVREKNRQRAIKMYNERNRKKEQNDEQSTRR